MKKIYPFALVFIIILPLLSFSQNIEKLKSLFPNADAVIKQRSEILHIKRSNGKFEITRDYSETKIILKTPPFSNFWVERIYFDSFEKIRAIEGDKISNSDLLLNSKAEKYGPQSTIRSSGLYNDEKVYKLWFNQVKKGDKINIKYERIHKNPRMFGPFFFMDSEPCLKAKFSIRSDKNIEIGWSYYGPEKYHVTFSKGMSNGENIYTWTLDSIPAFEEEDYSPSFQELAPQIIYYIKSVTERKKKKIILDSVSALHNWYRSLVKRANLSPPHSVASLTREIIDTCETKDEKVKAIFQWVQSNIKYINTSVGMGGFVPDDAEEVLKNRYGDCKAMTNLSITMLRLARINSYFCWIGTFDLPYNYTNNFTVSTDNHMIIAIRKNGKVKLLDATNSYGEFYKTPFYLQGKEALISLADSNFAIFKIPEESHEDNIMIDSNYIYEKEGRLFAKENIEVSGSLKLKIETDFPLIHDDIIEYIDEHFLTANAKTKIDHIEYSGIKDRSNTMNVKFNYQLFNHEIIAENKKYINLNMDRPLYDFNIDLDQRKTDFLFDFARTEHYIVVYKIPEDYQVTNLPPDIHADFNNYSVHINYQEIDGTVLMRRDVILKNRRIKKDNFEEWNEFVSSYKDAYFGILVLEKNNTSELESHKK